MMQDSKIQMQTQDRTDLPAHLILLDDGEWAIWRWIGLRSAGFSHDDLKPLVSSACVAAAEKYLALERQEQVEPDERAAARATFEHAYQEAALQTLHSLHHIASVPAFREALVWQNRQVLHTGVDVLLAALPDLKTRTSKYRQKEALITSYVQRYCTKNDTIGFFGPVGWACCVDDGPLLVVRPGPTLLASRTTYFEGWCIDALAQHLARDEAFQPWLKPRLLPHLWLDGTRLHLPLASPLELDPVQAKVLAACDGRYSARQIALALLRANTPGIHCEADVYTILHELRAKRRIAWTLEVSVEGMQPEQRLRAQLAEVEREDLRLSALATLDQLEIARTALTHARGDAERLDQAMANLEATFEQITNREATRHAGAMYAGRALVYEDCRRDVQVEIGPELASTLGPPLSLLLTSARWFTAEAAILYQDALRTVYEELCQQKQTARVSFGDFWLYAHALLFDRQHPLLTTLRQKLQQRWQAILAPELAQHQVAYQVARIKQAVSEAFAAAQPGWSAAYYHSPDLMLATPSPEHLRQGQYYYVLGELHPGGNTLRSAFFPSQHPFATDLHKAIADDCPQALVLPVFSREARGVTTRLSNGFIRPQDWRLVFASDSCEVPVNQALPLGRLSVECTETGLHVSTHDQRQHWKLIDFLGDLIMIQIVQHFSLLPAATHTPRITFDRLVVQRETWRFASQEIPFAALTSESERFLTARRWMHTHELPRRVFVKTPAEPKPFYVDFESLASVDVCARALRRAAQRQDMITFSEMLPDLHETWLHDLQQRPYTSELRIVAVDRHAC
jgi:hypothetical protein